MTTQRPGERPADARGHRVLIEGDVTEDHGDALRVDVGGPPGLAQSLWIKLTRIVYWGGRAPRG